MGLNAFTCGAVENKEGIRKFGKVERTAYEFSMLNMQQCAHLKIPSLHLGDEVEE